MTAYRIGTLKDFPVGCRKIVQVERKSIGIFNVDGVLYALKNLCPHQGAPLCEGLVTPYVVSASPTEFSFEREGEIIRCPWHQWEFDIKTGCMIVDPAKRTMKYDVSVENYDVTVESEAVFVHI